MGKNPNNIKGKYLFLLLLLTFINFWTYGWVALLLILPVALFMPGFGSRIDGNVLLLLLFSITYCTIGDIMWRGTGFLIFMIIGVPFAYMLGKYMASTNSEVGMIKILIYCAISLGLISMMSIITEIANVGFLGDSRNLIDISTSEIFDATGMSSRMSLMIGFSGIMIVTANTKAEKLLRITMLLVSLFALFCTLRIGTRTSIFLFITSIIISYLYNIKNISSKNRVIIFVVVSFIVAGTYWFFQNSDDNIYLTFFADRLSNDEYGFDSGGGRTQLQYRTLEMIPDYPMGGMPNNIDGNFYAHNLWLDIARVSGIIPMFLSIIITIISIIKLKIALQNKKLSIFTKTIFLTIMVTVILQFMVEPILEGVMPLYIYYCFFWGILCSCKENTGHQVSYLRILSEENFHTYQKK